ncbi:MAG: GerMN domain-containing protein [Pseudonocardiales bacterium]
MVARRLVWAGAGAAVIAVAVAVVMLSDDTSPQADGQPKASASAPPAASGSTTTAGVAPSIPAVTPTAKATATATATATPTSAPRSAAAPEVGEAVAVYYLGDTGTHVALYREWHKTTARDHVSAAVQRMLTPPADPDYQTLWPIGTTLGSVRIVRDLATVDFSSEVLQGGQGGSAAACQMLQQLVWTVTGANPSIRRVAVSAQGRTEGVISQWWGVGCGPDVPLVRHSPAYDVLAPVQISTYNDGDPVRSRFSFGGEATVFEGTVSWSVVGGGGTVLASGSAHASKGAPERGLWQANVVLPGVQPGDGVQLRAWEASAKDGSVTNLDTKTVVITR